MSALQDRAVSVTMAPDKEAEGQFAPPPQELRKRLLLADRGYENQRMLREIQEQGGAYIIRGKKNIRPLIRRAWDSNGRALRRLQGKQLTWDVLPNCHVDLEVSWGQGANPCDERIVVFPVRGSRNRRSFIYLHTSLSRDEFTAWHVGQLYRLRWQIELLFNWENLRLCRGGSRSLTIPGIGLHPRRIVSTNSAAGIEGEEHVRRTRLDLGPSRKVEVVRQPSSFRHVQGSDRRGADLGKSARCHASALHRTRRRAHARARHVDDARCRLCPALPRASPSRAARFRTESGSKPRRCVRLHARQHLPRAPEPRPQARPTLKRLAACRSVLRTNL